MTPELAAEIEALKDRVADLEAAVAAMLTPKDADPTGVRRFAERLREAGEGER